MYVDDVALLTDGNREKVNEKLGQWRKNGSKTKFRENGFRRSDGNSIGKGTRQRRAIDEVPEVETFECLAFIITV